MPLNTGMPVQNDGAAQTLQNAATGTGNGSAAILDGRSQFLTLSISGGIATVIPEHSFDGGATYEVAFVEDLSTGVAALTGAITAAASVTRFRYRAMPGASRFRARISAFVSGTITATAIERRAG